MSPPEMAQWLATYKDILLQIKTENKKEVGTWTLSSAGKRSAMLRNMIATLESLATPMAAHVH